MLEEIKSKVASSEHIIELENKHWEYLDAETAKQVVGDSDSQCLMRLPQRDIEFFEWLKTAAEEVWQDLWGADSEDTLYTVSTALLPELVVEHRGFPVCDLQTVPNFYFTQQHFRGEQGDHYMQAIHERQDQGEKLTVAQVFALEVERAPIDKWRFAWMYDLPLTAVDDCIRELVEDEVLMYTATREELSDYLDFDGE